MLTVKELQEQIVRISPTYSPKILGSLEYIPLVDGETGRDGLVDRVSGEYYAFDDEVFSNFAKFIQVPAKFAEKLPMSLRGQVIGHFIEQRKDEEVVMTHFGNQFQNMYENRKVLLPSEQIMDMVGRLFKPTDVISKVDFKDGLILNIRTEELSKAVKVGDVTQGGIRFNALHGATPQVSPYMERLVCTNGMVATSDLDSIPVRGFTLNEILTSMERMADHYLTSTIPDYLENWRKLTEIRSVNPEQLIHRLSRENDLSTKIESRIIEAAASLEDSSYYDVINLITSFQHAEGVDETQFCKLQCLGGNAVRDLGGHRCINCQHNLEL